MKSRPLSACLAVSLLSLCASRAFTATNSILPGQIKSGSITAVGQIDTYAFAATAGDVLTVTLLLTNGPGTYPYWELYGPDSTVVAAVSGSPTLAYRDQLSLPLSGTYTIGVMDDTRTERFDYRLGLQNACGANLREAADGAETILPGQITSGRIDVADVDSFKFVASANDVISITLLQTNGLGTYPWWQLYGPDCTLLAQVSSHPVSHGDQMRLPLNGTYTILVLDNGLDEAFDYQLSVHSTCGTNQREAGDGAEAIVPGQFTGGHITPGDIDAFKFTASANDVVSIALLLTNGPGTYPYWQLYGPDCSLVTHHSAHPVAYWDQIRLPFTGTYTVLVLDDGLTEEFDYVLTTLKNPGPNVADPGETNLVAPGQVLTGTITPGDLDAYAFSVIAGDSFTVNLRVTSGMGRQPVLQLFCSCMVQGDPLGRPIPRACQPASFSAAWRRPAPTRYSFSMTG